MPGNRLSDWYELRLADATNPDLSPDDLRSAFEWLWEIMLNEHGHQQAPSGEVDRIQKLATMSHTRASATKLWPQWSGGFFFEISTDATGEVWDSEEHIWSGPLRLYNHVARKFVGDAIEEFGAGHRRLDISQHYYRVRITGVFCFVNSPEGGFVGPDEVERETTGERRHSWAK